MKKILYIAVIALMITSCKKSSSSEPGIVVSIVSTGGASPTLPDTVHFSTSTNDFDNVTWDFGDGTTGTGLTTSHNYTHYGCFTVTVTAKKGSATAVNTKMVPVSIFKRIVLTTLEVLSIPAKAQGGGDWDDGSNPDLTYSIVFPGDTTYDATTVLWNVVSGTFNLPVKGTYNLAGDIKFEIFDKDTGDIPDRAPMGNATLNVCQYLNGPNPTAPQDSAVITNGPIALKVKWVWIPL